MVCLPPFSLRRLCLWAGHQKGPVLCQSLYLASGRMTGLSGLYLLGPPAAVFASSVMATRQADRTAPCSAHLLIWRRVERKADSGCIYWVCRPRFFASPVCGKRHVDRYAVFHRDAPCVQKPSGILAFQIRRLGKRMLTPASDRQPKQQPWSIDAVQVTLGGSLREIRLPRSLPTIQEKP